MIEASLIRRYARVSLLLLALTGVVQAQDEALTVSVLTDKELYARSELVMVAVRLTNSSTGAVRLDFPTSCQASILVFDGAGALLWDEAQHQACSPIATSLILQPGQTQTYPFTWTQIDDFGAPVPVNSEYLIRGRILSLQPVPEGMARIFIGAACNDGRDNDGDGLIDFPSDPGCLAPEDDDERNVALDWRVRVTTDQALYLPGEPVQIEVQLTNQATQAFRIVLESCPAHFTVVETVSGAPIYDESLHRFCFAPVRIYVVEPDQTLHFPFTWGQIDDDDSPIRFPADLTVRGFVDVVDSEQALPGATTRILVGPACHDGLDNDADGLTDHPADPGCLSPVDPDETDALILRIEPGRLTWNVMLEALAYDVVSGLMLDLRNSGGDFTSSVRGCLVNDHPDTSLPFTGTPPVGNGFWFLARAEFPEGPGTWDDVNDPTQRGSRDAELDASSLSCP